MRNQIICTVSILLLSCVKPKYENNTNIYWDEVDKKNKYFLELIDSKKEIGLYEDFNFWELQPTKRINELRMDLDFPIIETRNKNKQLSDLIIHSNYQHSDTLSLAYNSDYCLIRGRLGCFCSNDIFTEIYVYADSLIYFAYNDAYQEDDPPLLAISRISKEGFGKLFLYTYINDSIAKLKNGDRRSILSKNIHRIPDNFTVVYSEIYLEDTKAFNVEFYNTLYDYSNDTSSISSYTDYYNEYDSYRNHDPVFYSYNDYDVSACTFPRLRKDVVHEDFPRKKSYKSFFWFVWNTKLKNTAAICQGGCP